MIRILISIITCLLGLFASGQVKSTFTLSQQVSEIAVSSLVKVYIDSKSDAMEVKLSAQYAEGMERLELIQKGEKLLITLKKGKKATKGKDLDGIEVRLSQQAISKYDVQHMAVVEVEGVVEVEEAIINIASMGKLKLDVTAKKVYLDVVSQGTFSGSVNSNTLYSNVLSMGSAKVSGEVNEAKIEAMSQASFEGAALKVQRADVSAMSMGKIEVAPVAYLNASALSMARVIYVTQPSELKVHTGSMGKVKKR